MDSVWVTYVPDEVVIERLVERNGLSEEAARARLRSQMPVEQRLAKAAVAVDTSGPKDATKEKLRGHWEELIQRLREGHSTTA